MVSFDLQRMLIGEFPLTFLLEVALRVSAAFLAVFFFLKFSGRRGIRQLSRFELVVNPHPGLSCKRCDFL